MKYLGDFPVDGVVYFTFNTRTVAGVPYALADGAVVVRQNATAAPLTLDPAPVLVADFNSVTGLNSVTVDLADSDFVAGEYSVCLSAGTVNSVSVAGAVLAHFSIGRNTSPTAAAVADAVAKIEPDTFSNFVDSWAWRSHLAIQSLIGLVEMNRGAGTVTIYDVDDTTPLLILTLATVDTTDTSTPSLPA